MLIDTRDVDDLKVHLVTNEEEDKLPDLIDKLDDIKNDMIGYGIEFDYNFREFHDRCIKADNGWVISMGRGLGIVRILLQPLGRINVNAKSLWLHSLRINR